MISFRYFFIFVMLTKLFVFDEISAGEQTVSKLISILVASSYRPQPITYEADVLRTLRSLPDIKEKLDQYAAPL